MDFTKSREILFRDRDREKISGSRDPGIGKSRLPPLVGMDFQIELAAEFFRKSVSTFGRVEYIQTFLDVLNKVCLKIPVELKNFKVHKSSKYF